jgi:nucleotide-binding universal stress UspA family protein
MAGVYSAVTTQRHPAEHDRNLGGKKEPHRIFVCAETSESTAKMMPHAKAIAAALSAEVTLVHVMEPYSSLYTTTDPYEWELHRRKAEAFICALSKEHARDDDRAIATKVLQGRTGEQLSNCVATRRGDIAVLCRSDLQSPGHIGQTARRVLEAGRCSFLMVPAAADSAGTGQYRRVMVPLDGSSRAEAAIWVAKKIARAEDAELVLVHAAQEPFLIQNGPLESADVELKDRLLGRNEVIAREYLQRLCEQIDQCPVSVRPVILAAGDVRRQLNDAIVNESADLVVLSSHGDGGHADAATGDVAVFLLANSPVPVLMMRQVQNKGNSHIHGSTESRGVRLPTGAD